MFKVRDQSVAIRKKSPSKKQLAALAKGREIRSRNIKRGKRFGGALCPEGTQPFNDGLHCCRHDTDHLGDPIYKGSTGCKDNNYVKCENELDNTIPNEICYSRLSDRDQRHQGGAHSPYKETLWRLLVSYRGQDLSKSERAYIENVRVHY